MKIRRFSFLVLMILISSSSQLWALAPSLNSKVKSYNGTKGNTIYLPLSINIPEGAYIYGNPKGPGIGKPLEVEVTSSSCEAGTPFIDKPQKYFPDGNDFVYIYRSQVTMFIPIHIIKEDNSSIVVKISGLMCTNAACSLFTLSNTFNFDKTADVSMLSSLPQSGMLELGKFTSLKTKETNIVSQPISNQHVFVPRFLSFGVSGLFYALCMGLLSGLILNFMPCVFPVLGIKLAGIINHSQNNKGILKNSLFYSAGILFSFIILASLVSFAGYRWGTLFQQSSFLIVIILIIFMFALSLFGVFKINIPKFAGKASTVSFKNQELDSFFKGCLAALLSTPCSGPLLGSTLAWSLTQQPFVIFAVFTAIGTGLSSPYIFISLFPKVLFFIPKPGEWMVVFEKLLGFLLLGSALFFINALNEQLFIPVLSMMLLTSIGLWQYGRWGNISQTDSLRILSAVLLIVIVSASLYWPMTATPTQKKEISSEYSFSKLIENEKAGKTSIVVFTADWCTNCKFVEQSVLKSAEIEKLRRQENISFLVADITEKGAEGEILLNQLRSVSIPFLAIFPPGKNFDHPVCLRDIYTRKEVMRALETSREN